MAGLPIEMGVKARVGKEVVMKTLARFISHISKLMFVLMFGLVANINAEVIYVPINGSLSGFAPNLYRGQTFIAPQGIAEELTVYVGESNAYEGPVTYHVLITEINETAEGIQPTYVLFESDPLVTNIGYSTIPPAVTVDLGMLTLSAGEKYAWILDAYVELDNNPPVNPGGPYPSALVGLNDIYSDNFPEIERISLNLGPFPSGTRQDHFSGYWPKEPLDHAFTMKFTEEYEIIDIDIQPHKKDNKIRIDNSALIPVAILSTADFDARLVDPNSVKFGPSGAAPVERLTRFKNVNGDRYIDHYFRFVATDTGIQCEDVEADLTGTWIGLEGDEVPILGNDTFTVQHCK